MTVETEATDIKDTFAFLDDWEARYEHIIDLGKSLPPMNEDLMVDTYRVPGCASQVWIVPTEAGQDDTLIEFQAQSDAILVSGLIALLSQLFNGKQARDILDFDAPAFFTEIGLEDALSAQRANGLRSMLERIRRVAQARLCA